MASEDASTTFSLSIPREADTQTYWLLFNKVNSVGLKETAQGSPMCPDLDSSMCEWEGKSFFNPLLGWCEMQVTEGIWFCKNPQAQCAFGNIPRPHSTALSISTTPVTALILDAEDRQLKPKIRPLGTSQHWLKGGMAAGQPRSRSSHSTAAWLGHFFILTIPPIFFNVHLGI